MNINPKAFRPDFRDLEVEQSMTEKLNREYRTPHMAPRHRSALNAVLEVHVKALRRRTRLVVRAAIERQIMRQQVQRYSPQDPECSDSGLDDFHAELAKIQGRIEFECQAAQRECIGLSRWLENQEQESAQRRHDQWAHLQRTIIANLSGALNHADKGEQPSLSDTVILCRDGLSHARTQALESADADHSQRLAHLSQRCTEMNVALRTIRALFKRLRQVSDFDPDRAELIAAIQGPHNEEQSLQLRWSAMVSIFRSNLALQPPQLRSTPARSTLAELPESGSLQRAS